MKHDPKRVGSTGKWICSVLSLMLICSSTFRIYNDPIPKRALRPRNRSVQSPHLFHRYPWTATATNCGRWRSAVGSLRQQIDKVFIGMAKRFHRIRAFTTKTYCKVVICTLFRKSFEWCAAGHPPNTSPLSAWFFLHTIALDPKVAQIHKQLRTFSRIWHHFTFSSHSKPSTGASSESWPAWPAQSTVFAPHLIRCKW